ncbi:small metal-binding protein SmbP [Methylocystis sp.]|uniref:small metal-binding protein SmbP n=1 Tax=Methylocystis sp. TaxID=1911079 RepID=UPI003DA2B7BD
MTRRMSVFAILTALALAFSGPNALAGIGVHVQAAIEHAQEAIDDGAKGDSKEVVTHVMSALGHAREALHEKAVEGDRAANKLLHRAIRHLRLAEMRARFGDSARAVKHATSALAELKKVK